MHFICFKSHAISTTSHKVPVFTQAPPPPPPPPPPPLYKNFTTFAVYVLFFFFFNSPLFLPRPPGGSLLPPPPPPPPLYSHRNAIWLSGDVASWYIVIIHPTRCTNFSNLFLDSSSVQHQEFFTVNTAMVYVVQVCCVYSEKLLMMTEELSETCRILFQK